MSFGTNCARKRLSRRTHPSRSIEKETKQKRARKLPVQDNARALSEKKHELSIGEMKMAKEAKPEIEAHRAASHTQRTDIAPESVKDISAALTALLADVFALYVKTKNFHWHMSGLHFRDYHLMLDEQSGQIFAMTDVIAERARKIGPPATPYGQ